MKKGLDVFAINEDTHKTTKLWTCLWITAKMVYLSPEMELSDSFMKLWKDSKFWTCLTAIVVDKAHCIDEWGDNTFIPHIANLATCCMASQSQISHLSHVWQHARVWHSIWFSHHWATAVVCSGVLMLGPIATTFSISHTFSNILPPDLSPNTCPEDLPNTLLYLDSKAGCHSLVQSLHKCLPQHLCTCVHHFLLICRQGSNAEISSPRENSELL